MENTIKKINHVLESAECLYDWQQINAAFDKLANEITQRLSDKNPLILCVMTGAIIPTGHLVTRLNFPLEMDYIHATRYNSSTTAGEVKWIVKPRTNLKNRTVLIVDDVMDGGLTLAAIVDYCKEEGANDVLTAVAVNKKRPREKSVNFEPDFSGLITDDRYLIGFGLDYQEYLRNIPGIYAVAKEHQ